MHSRVPAGMAEALRLTRSGRLIEATALIQRALGRAPARGGSSDRARGAAEPHEAARRVVSNPPPFGEASTRSATDRTSRASTVESARRGVPDESGTIGRRLQPELARTAAPRHNRRVGAPARGLPSIPSTGQFIERSYTNPAGTRAYKLYIPSGYTDTGQARPLVVLLHGCSQSPADFAAGTRMNVLAEESQFLVAYPAQVVSANAAKCWNWFLPADQRRGKGEPSLIAGITQQIRGEYRIDPHRIYVAGLSAGGAMAAILGATYPDLFAAIGVHSGLAYGAAWDLPSALRAMKHGGPNPQLRGREKTPGPGRINQVMPTIVFHGDRDTTVHHINADQVLTHTMTVQTDPKKQTVGADHPRVTVRRGQVSGGHAFTQTTYRDARGRVVLERWLVHGAGHAWFGGSDRGSFTDPKGPDASREMVRFFLAHGRDQW